MEIIKALGIKMKKDYRAAVKAEKTETERWVTAFKAISVYYMKAG